ncbi:hypothetical protein NDU88_002952 [Pleurodeles waltl]|uniref:Uncharacterized protein n=1 Tax=Pleurodeles waltl TaxID=8319 RepID=A0AAV7VC15_PLEWA|nr:hypothetical protein NDU88_002952 [Pleurodeles waltl]
MCLWNVFRSRSDPLLHASSASNGLTTAPRGPAGVSRPLGSSPFAAHAGHLPLLVKSVAGPSQGQSWGRAACRCLHGPGPAFIRGCARFPLQRCPSAFKGGSPGSPLAAPVPPGQQGDPAEVQAASRPSARAPWRHAPRVEATAPITELGRRPLSVRSAQSRSKTPPGVAARTQQLPDRSPARRSRLSPNPPGEGTLLVDPSGARRKIQNSDYQQENYHVTKYMEEKN